MMWFLEGSVGTALVGVCRAHRNRAAAALGEVGLYVGQEWVLLNLLEQEGVTQSELAAACDVEAPTMSKALERMERAGAVQRRADAEDARVTRIHLTAKGRELAEEVQRIWTGLEQATVAGLSAEERLLLRRLLLQVRSNLEPDR